MCGKRIPAFIQESDTDPVCLSFFDTCEHGVFQGFLLGKYYFVRHKWDVGGVLLLLVSLIDWAVSAGFGCTEVLPLSLTCMPFPSNCLLVG